MEIPQSNKRIRFVIPMRNSLLKYLVFFSVLILFCQCANRMQTNKKAMIAGEKYYLPMPEDQFWGIVHKSFITHDDHVNGENLRLQLAMLDDSSIVKFHLRLTQLMVASYLGSLWCAADIMQGGCGDSEFTYFRMWLVGRGKDKFEKALKNPDILVDEDAYVPDGFISWSLWQMPMEMLNIKYGDSFSIHNCVDYERFENLYGKEGADIDLSWGEDETLKKQICPKLYAKYIAP